MSETPLEWFYGGIKNFPEMPPRHPYSWRVLGKFGWTNVPLDAGDYGDLPGEAGIYVIVHEMESPALYVGESENIAQRLGEIIGNF